MLSPAGPLPTSAEARDPERPADRGDLLCTLAVVCVALLVRLVYLYQSADNPSFRAPIVDAGTFDRLARQLADKGTLSPDLFWQSLLYPVTLAGIYRGTGGSIVAARILQSLLGVATCWLV